MSAITPPSSPAENQQQQTEWRVFPPSKQPTQYRQGDLVFVRSKSAKEKGRRGTVVSVSEDDCTSSSHRLVVRGCSSRPWEKSVPAKRCIPVLGCSHSNKTLVVVTGETTPYRHLASSQLCQEDDDVLEIGCSTGQASAILVRYAKTWVGFDTSSEMIEMCKLKLSQQQQQQDNGGTTRCLSVKMDPFVDPAGAVAASKLVNAKGPNVVFCDIGGNRNLDSVVKMISWSTKTYSPRLLVVKSRELLQKIFKSAKVDQTSGAVRDGHAWFSKMLNTTKCESLLPPHPLQAPLVLSPLDEKTPICRYHNYHSLGCNRKQDCPLDHKHCHKCRQVGHVARSCPTYDIMP